jgi:hypothetical protein
VHLIMVAIDPTLQQKSSPFWKLLRYYAPFGQWVHVAIPISTHQKLCGILVNVFRSLTYFVCLYTYEFWLSLCKIVRSSLILLLPLITMQGTKLTEKYTGSNFFIFFMLEMK